MDCKQFCEGFKMRCGTYPEGLFFSGMPLKFFESDGITIGCGTTIGAMIGVSPREDGRLVVGFSDSDCVISCNKAEFSLKRSDKIIALMLWAEKNGVKTNGADVLIHYNTKLVHPYENAVLMSLESFCENVPQNNSLLLRREDAGANILSAMSRVGNLSIFDGQRIRYAPFSEEKYKIVICSIDEKNFVTGEDKGYTKDAEGCLISGDIEGFGEILSRKTSICLKKNSKTRRLFTLCVNEGTMIGGGAAPGGGIFSIVEADKVDTFIGEVRRASEMVGDVPEFYVTCPAECGSIAIHKG